MIDIALVDIARNDVARMLSDTLAGIAPASVPAFLLMQILGAAAAAAVVALLYPRVAATAETAVVPHDGAGLPGPDRRLAPTQAPSRRKS